METVSSSTSPMDIVLSVIYAARVELTFLLVFGILWASGRQLAWPLGAGSGKSSKGFRKQPPSTANTSPSPKPGLRKREATSAAARSERSNHGQGQMQMIDVSDIASVPSEKLRTPAWLVPQVLHMCRMHIMGAMELYNAGLAAGLDLSEVRPADIQQVCAVFIPSLLRAGRSKEVVRLLADMRGSGRVIEPSLITSLIKLATSRQMYKEAIDVFDFVAEDSAFVFDDKSVWSCLIFCSVETKHHIFRCKTFFQRLCAMGEATAKDFGNMVRYGASIGDWQLCVRLLGEMKAGNMDIDSVVYNTTLAACVSGEQLDTARRLLQEMEIGQSIAVADVITYNTLAKGYVKAGCMDQCLEIFQLMRSRNIVPSQVTYGILLDGYINDNQVVKAAEVFEMMKKEGCQMNTVLYTTLIKGLARASQVDQAMDMYNQMRVESGAKPDLITFSVLVKANCDSGRLDAAIGLLKGMKEQNLAPDEVVYNNLISGCAKECNAPLGRQIYKDMIASGTKPSNATFSVMIQLYANCKMLEDAVEMLRTEPAAVGMTAEPRLYSQLTLSCLRIRQGRRASEVHELMLQRSTTSESVHRTLIAMSIRLNMIETGTEILCAAANAGAPVSEADALDLLDATVKRKKTSCAEACRSAIEKLQAFKAYRRQQ